MELAEREETIRTLKEDLTRERAMQQRQVAETVDQRLETLFGQAAAPVAQFLTQGHLVEEHGKEVPVRDVVRLTRRIVRALEEAGLEICEVVGSHAAFNANLHEPLSAGQAIDPGTPIAVQFCGIAFRGRVLRKAGVAAVRT
jgi:molecular chaperone GrpE (heat shock protein)